MATTPQPVQDLKHALRQAMRHALARHDPRQRAVDSDRIRQRLAACPEFAAAGHILGFVPLPSEPDLLPLLAEALQSGQRIFLPRWDEASRLYRPALMPSQQELVPGPFAIPEPPPSAETLPHQRLDLILVPGLAFDRAGRRLGRGRGFYDRLLAQADQARRWGIAFDFQVVTAVPHETHDVKLHRIATPSFWLTDNHPVPS